jgi:outer membrane lipoprotein SlyB
MSTTTALSATPGQMASSSMKALWIAVGVLGTAVLVMAATMVQMHKQSTQARESMPGMNAQAMAMPAPALPAPAPVAANTAIPTDKSLTAQESIATPPAAKPVASPAARPAPREQRVASNAKPAPVRKAVPVTTPTPAPVTASGYPPVASSQPTPVEPAPAPVAQLPKPVCASCGTVESVTPVTRNGEGTGLGAIAGGVIGGVLGNQIGKGSGRTAGTVVGAVGGGVAGHHIERRMRQETIYSVVVRMDDGSTRTLQQKSAPAAGSKVTVEGGVIRGADGTSYGDATRAPRKPTPAPTDGGNA